MTRQYASVEILPEDGLNKPKKQFLELFQSNEKWQQRAKADLTDILNLIPNKISDGMTRIVAIAGFLDELKLVDKQELAKELLAKVKPISENPDHGQKQIVAVLRRILECDPLLSEEVVNVVLAQNKSLKDGLALVGNATTPDSPQAKKLAAILLAVADRHWHKDTHGNVWEFLNSARQIDQACDYLSLCKKWAQEKSNGQDPEGAAMVIKYMVDNEQNTERLHFATDLYVQLVSDYETRIPPPEIKQRVDHIIFDKLKSEAEQLVEKGEYEKAVKILEDTRFKGDPIDQDLLFSAYLGIVRLAGNRSQVSERWGLRRCKFKNYEGITVKISG